MHCFVEPAPQRSYFDRQLVHSDSDPDLFDLFDNFAQRMNPSIARVAPFDIDRARSLMNLFLFIRGKPLPLMTYINEMPLTAEPLTYEQLRVIEERRGHGKALHHDIYNDLLLHPFFANAHGHGIGAVLAADDDDTMVDGMPTDMEIAYMEDLTKAAASLMSNGMQGWSFNLKRE